MLYKRSIPEVYYISWLNKKGIFIFTMSNVFFYVATICVVTVTLVILIFFKRLFKKLNEAPKFPSIASLFGNLPGFGNSDDDYIDKTKN